MRTCLCEAEPADAARRARRPPAQATEEALARAIAICGPGVPIKSIGATIHAFADTYGYGVVEAFVGHGVGRDFHSAPTVVHCRNNVPGTMEPGMTFTIEPMLTLGGTRERAWR